jgi:hypothetical protein
MQFPFYYHPLLKYCGFFSVQGAAGKEGFEAFPNVRSEEERGQPAELFNEVGEPMEAFNLKREREDGHFVDGGDAYVAHQQPTDAWLEALDGTLPLSLSPSLSLSLSPLSVCVCVRVLAGGVPTPVRMWVCGGQFMDTWLEGVDGAILSTSHVCVRGNMSVSEEMPSLLWDGPCEQLALLLNSHTSQHHQY